MDQQESRWQMQFWGSTRSGAATSCVLRARDALLPIRGSRTNRCPRPTRYAPAARVRETGGVSGKNGGSEAVEEYLRQVDFRGAIAGVRNEAEKIGGLRGQYLAGLRFAWRRCGTWPWRCWGRASRCRMRAALRRRPGSRRSLRSRDESGSGGGAVGRAGYPSSSRHTFCWSGRCVAAGSRVPMASVRALGAAVIAHFDHLSATNLLPYLPQELARVPRANIDFLPIKDAWFSGSMNYMGRARKADGTPKYEATYEINASLQISVPEFEQLVSHEVVPGHVTTFAYLQNLYARASGFRSHGVDHEHAGRDAVRGHCE